jgi:hypothetical protein
MFAGILITLIIALIVYILWRRKRNRKKKLLTSSTTTTPVITPPLYNVSISRHNSLISYNSTMINHIYEELP